MDGVHWTSVPRPTRILDNAVSQTSLIGTFNGRNKCGCCEARNTHSDDGVSLGGSGLVRCILIYTSREHLYIPATPSIVGGDEESCLELVGSSCFEVLGEYGIGGL